MVDQVPVLLDTDIGNDIDDAVCLAYLLAHPRCDLLGITTVTADPVARARLASVLCRVAGREVPIRPGAARPLAPPALQKPPPQAAVLPRWPHETSFPAGDAVEFLRRTIRSRPGEVTLLTIGPLTNVALLFAADPDIPSLLGSLVHMAGAFLGAPRRPEWNVHCDPRAAAEVYAASVRRHRSVGLDVTTRVWMDAASFLDRCAAPLLRPVADMASTWFAERPRVYFHDPLAAATIFDPAFCSFAPGTVTVTGDGEFAGITRWRAGRGGAHEVAVDVEPAAFFEHYFETVTGVPGRP